jgi:hypothetical protein
VTICHAAAGSTEYWIISRVVSDGDVLWFAKTQVSGDRSGPFSFRLYADAASQGDRDYVVVAARTGDARTWLQNNLDADRTQGDFDFNDLHDGIDEISARVHSAT